ncbi:zygotic DNA replication licensing factor mcm3-like [Uloborus diversus]|uniref:zygotic DNA replication licensing factor mcm3-like n=1 Tax=Uloborus diversus TaxID=327109 RepID=UPI002409158A|nr:zygotic DNA replication licensing factor mcm3-like [Uloborus diversus]
MSNTVNLKDAQAAIDLVQFAYFKKVMEKEKKRRREDGSSDEEEIEEAHKKKKQMGKPRPKPGEEGYDPYDFDEEGPESASQGRRSQPTDGPSTSKESESASQSEISESRMKDFRSILSQLFKVRHAQSVPLSVLTDFVAERQKDDPFTPEEINLALEQMTEANQVMVANEIVFLI